MGATGAITDVAGIRVGHVQKSGDGWLSGVTVVLPPPGTVGSVDVRGGGPATHETDSLDPTTLSRTVDAVVLTGGSAFGLAAAHGAQRWCEENGRGFPVPGGLVPIVPAAAIFDLGRGGDFAARPGRGHGLRGHGRRRRAAGRARRRTRQRRSRHRSRSSAGDTYKGGVGTASITLENISETVRCRRGHSGRQRAGTTVRHIAQRTEPGSVRLSEERASTPRVSAAGRKPRLQRRRRAARRRLNTTLVVVATNAILDKADCKRTASAAHAGLARALDPSHTLADGDTVFCLATGAVALDRSSEAARQVSLITLQSAAADVVRLAILDGIARAEAVTHAGGRLWCIRTLSALRLLDLTFGPQWRSVVCWLSALLCPFVAGRHQPINQKRPRSCPVQAGGLRQTTVSGGYGQEGRGH